jgi:Na+/proline symporter
MNFVYLTSMEKPPRISSGLQPASMYNMHSTWMAALAAANNVIQSMQAGMVQSADEMDSDASMWHVSNPLVFYLFIFLFFISFY